MYHLDRVTWRDTSVEYLKLWDAFEDNDDKQRHRWESSSDAKIFEAIIALLGDAIALRLGRSLGVWARRLRQKQAKRIRSSRPTR
jgi:hypothetical protein